MNVLFENEILVILFRYLLVFRSFVEVIVEIVVGCILFIFGIIGNGLVCYVIVCSCYIKLLMYFFMV